MALDDFTGQNIQETYQRVVQTEGALFADGTGSALNILTADQTGSFAVKTAISGSFVEPSSSFSARISILEATEDHTHSGVVSGSSQLATEISGAFKSTSSSIAADISGNVTDISSLTNATSSYLKNTTDTLTGNLTITGKLIAEQYIISSSVLLMTQSFSSGSTIFGDDTSDVHQFTGSVYISGSTLQLSGELLFSSSLNTSTDLKTLVYDELTGKIYHTGSYGGSGGGSGTGAGFPFSGSAIITGSFVVSGSTSNEDATFFADVLPGKSDEYILGSSTKKWNSVFATNTFFGGIHEINLETIGISQLQTGTVLVSNAGQMVPCDVQGDPLVMGIVTSGSDYPVVMGAEPVLVDGPVYEGDYIITSNKLGFGKAIPPNQIFEQKLFGKIIAQSLETNLSGGPVKAMIRKM